MLLHVYGVDCPCGGEPWSAFCSAFDMGDPAAILKQVSPGPKEGSIMALTIYGNRLSPEAPANLQLDVQGLEKLYGLADVNGHGQVAPLLIATPVVEK